MMEARNDGGTEWWRRVMEARCYQPFLLNTPAMS
jgi:hypothetical protein